MKTFFIDYDFVTASYEVCGSTEEDTENYTYQIDDDELQDLIVDLVFKNLFKKEIRATFNKEQVSQIKLAIKEMIEENDLWENYFEEWYYEIKQHFESQALKEWKYGE